MKSVGPKPPTLKSLIVWVLIGSALLWLGWVFPARFQSLSHAVLIEAGKNGESLAAHAGKQLAAGQLGPLDLTLRTLDPSRNTDAAALQRKWSEASFANPNLSVIGGPGPLTDILLTRVITAAPGVRQPIYPALIPELARQKLSALYGQNPTARIQALLQFRTREGLTRLPAANKPGGQVFEAALWLAVLLDAGDYYTPSLADELRHLSLSDSRQSTERIEDFSLSLIALGQRLDWMQLVQIIRKAADIQTVVDISQWIQDEEKDMPVICAAVYFSQDPKNVAAFLNRFGASGVRDLRVAMLAGKPALQLLLDRRLPLETAEQGAAAAPSFLSKLTWRQPNLALFLKYTLLLAGCWIFSWVTTRLLGAIQPITDTRTLRMQNYRRRAIAAIAVVFILAASEPMLLQPARSSDAPKARRIPVLSNAHLAHVNSTSTSNIMKPDISSIVTIILFSLLQSGVYLTCLLKIREIEQSPVGSALKLRLLENEENLFDMGLYVGIGGTATALILQVLGVIESNLLAAFTSNLLGILCVAVIKIHHVRNCKQRLILSAEAQS